MFENNLSIEDIFSEQVSFLVKPLISEVFSSESLCQLGLKTDEEIDLSEGDFIKVYGKSKTTVCQIKKINYGVKENIIYLPMRIKKKLDIQYNNLIRIQPFIYRIAGFVKITPIDFDFQPSPKINQYIKKKLFGQALIKKDVISVPIGFLRQIQFEVLDIQPTSPAQIALGTTVSIVMTYVKEKQIKEDIILTLTM